MAIRIGNPRGEQIDSLTTDAVPAGALGTTITSPVLTGTLALPSTNFLVIDEHTAQSTGLTAGDRVVTLLPTGERVRAVITAVIARGLNGDDTYVSAADTVGTGKHSDSPAPSQTPPAPCTNTARPQARVQLPWLQGVMKAT
ncbi:hypothetical protein AB0L85_29645 [Streptomyces sp. NPDC052051]|uniref:hypothetical protein n=1 Tax=Streptomyces sp. NPDC052051 TaxID=3154649 RepID=UPI00344821B9